MLLLSCLACPAAQAAPFADPTQPPGAVAGGAESTAGAAEGPRLQSVLISPNRRVAVIGGQAVHQGGMYGEARVLRISEGEVVLQVGQERQTLRLIPDVDKRASRPANRGGKGHKGVGK